MKRRTFLKNTSLFSLPAFLGGFSISAMPSRLMESLVNGDSDRVLVLIDLNGGNDGLATLVPLDSYDNLANARPNVIIPENTLLDFTDTIGLHPELGGMKNLYENGNLNIIQGVGYENQNRSHFRSSDIWNTAVPADEYKPTGWLGRYLDDVFPGYPAAYPTQECPDPFAITMGTSISTTCQGAQSNFSLAIINTSNLGGLSVGVEAPLTDDCYGEEMAFLIETYKKSNIYADRVIAAADTGNSNTQLYPDTRLAQQLSTVAKLISGGMQTRVYVLTLGGFDTHADQVVDGDPITGDHAELLKTLSDAIYAFQEDIKSLGLEERVLGMTFSEFGRKIISNAGNGTDHGSAAPLFVFGSCVRPGIIGANPLIADQVDEEEGVAMQYDFKSIYGSILIDWLEVEEEKVKEFLVLDFQYLPIVGSCTTTSTEELPPLVNATAFPNPFVDFFTLRFNLEESAKVSIVLSDVLGKTVRVIGERSLTAGPHEVRFEAHDLSSGVYFARMEVGNSGNVVRVVKR